MEKLAEVCALTKQLTRLTQEHLHATPLVLYDGECGFCQFWVSFILKRDHHGVFRFAPLTVPGVTDLCRENAIAPTGNSVLLLDAQGLTEKSTAALKICWKLGGAWRVLAIVGLSVPKFLRDWVYNQIAMRRHSISRSIGSCLLPNAEQKQRFFERLPGTP